MNIVIESIFGHSKKLIKLLKHLAQIQQLSFFLFFCWVRNAHFLCQKLHHAEDKVGARQVTHQHHQNAV